MPQSENRPLEPLIQVAQALRVWFVRVALWFSIIVLVWLYVVKVWRRAAPTFASIAFSQVAAARALPRVIYRAELDRLSELSVRRNFGETREGFARRVASLSPSFTRLTDRHLAAKFADQASGSTTDPAELEALRQSVAQEVRRGVPLWKRVLGALSPWSWILSR